MEGTDVSDGVGDAVLVDSDSGDFPSIKEGAPEAVDECIMQMDAGTYYLTAKEVSEMVELDLCPSHTGMCLSLLSTHASVEYSVRRWSNSQYPKWQIIRHDLTEDNE